MNEPNIFDVVREAALFDKQAGASSPPTLPTVELQNWYDLNRKG